MPNRILREGILTSERVSLLDWPAEVFYRRLMSVVDDFGRYYAKPELLRAACYPLNLDKVGNSDIGKWLLATEKAALVRTYTVDGKQYLEMQDFRQQVRAKVSKFPAPDWHVHDACVADAQHMLADAHLDGDGDGDGGDKGPPLCPVERIKALYHEVLPVCPRVMALTEKRKTQIRTRWKENANHYATVDEGLDWWRRFFSYVSESEFLTGRAASDGKRPPFLADLEWLTNASNFVKVIEGKYHA